MRHLKLIGVLALVFGLVLIGLAYLGISDSQQANLCNDAVYAIDIMQQQINNQFDCEIYQKSNIKNINQDLLEEAQNSRIQGDCSRSLNLVRSIDTSYMCNKIISNQPSQISQPQELNVSWVVLGVMFLLSIVMIIIVVLLRH